MATNVFDSCVAAMHRRPTIRVGSRGPLVANWQLLLRRSIGAGIKTDGVFSPATQAATMAFQRKVGLPADGVVASRTWGAAAAAPCYALAASKLPSTAQPQRLAAHGLGALMAPAAAQRLVPRRRRPPLLRPVHGFGELSFSMIDMKSLVLGSVLGVAAGAVLFRRK